MARATQVKRQSLSAQVAATLRELIVSNTNQLLEAEGLITNVPYKGAVVTRLSAAEIEEYFAIRITLEVELLKLAIGSLAPAAVARARQIVARMDAAPPARWGEYNWLLHEELYAAANRPTTLEFVRRIHDNLDRYVRIQLALAEKNRRRAHREHIELSDLCEAGDRSGAARLLTRHIGGVRDDLLAHLRRQAAR